MSTNNPYEIKIEQAESAKNLVGKTLMIADGRKIQVLRWEGQNYIMGIDGKEGSYPVVVILDKIAKNIFKVQ